MIKEYNTSYHDLNHKHTNSSRNTRTNKLALLDVRSFRGIVKRFTYPVLSLLILALALAATGCYWGEQGPSSRRIEAGL
jgi:hypothetical protein